MRYPDCKDIDSFQSGLEFQDFVCEKLAREGIILQNLSSKKYQFDLGENLQGFEIKLDRRCTDTKRLSIEVAEKTQATNPSWVPSGIYRNDNAWLYIQGNYEVLYIFPTVFLRQLYQRGRFKIEELPTIKKFYLPFDKADQWCAKKLSFGDTHRTDLTSLPDSEIRTQERLSWRRDIGRKAGAQQ